MKSISFQPYSGYIKVFDGNGTQVYTRQGCRSNHTSNTFLEMAIQESQNITIEVLLGNHLSYASVSYGIFKHGLESGDGNGGFFIFV